MRILVFLNGLGLGGTEKAACRWAMGLSHRGHDVRVLSLSDGPRHAQLVAGGIDVEVLEPDTLRIASFIREICPQVIQAHVPGYPHLGDILGDALKRLPKIPVVQTNVFGRLENPSEDSWTDFRLFISWTSCIQAARRASRRLDREFFRRSSVAVYPLDSDDGPSLAEILSFRASLEVQPQEILFGRFSRPEPNKWLDLPIRAFRRAARSTEGIKFLLRSPPPAVVAELADAPDRECFLVLPATSDSRELRLSMAATDVVLHASSIGESFGYGIAEPMNFGRPVITNSVPWFDQAQIELVRHGECGFVASTERTMAEAMLRLSRDTALRFAMGRRAQEHIRSVSDPETSLDRLEGAMRVAIADLDNPRINEDLALATSAAAYLDRGQFGHTFLESLGLRTFRLRRRIRRFASAVFHPVTAFVQNSVTRSLRCGVIHSLVALGTLTLTEAALASCWSEVSIKRGSPSLNEIVR